MAWQAHNGKCLHTVRSRVSSHLPPGIKGDKSGEGKGRKGLNAEMITQPDSRLSLIALSAIVKLRSNSDADFLSRGERV